MRKGQTESSSMSCELIGGKRFEIDLEHRS